MYNKFFKRLLDIICACLALPILIIVFILLAPLIYFQDRGPIFYNSLRMGKNGENFKMYKFRSMKINAPDLRNSDGSTIITTNDLRVTKLGAFMRKTSLDELPQIINILIGDMSVIGPRPTLIDKQIEEYVEFERDRFYVRPGITGFSQAYYRNSISQEQKFLYDSFYANNISFIFDLKIFIKTIYSVIKSENVNKDSLV